MDVTCPSSVGNILLVWHIAPLPQKIPPPSKVIDPFLAVIMEGLCFQASGIWCEFERYKSVYFLRLHTYMEFFVLDVTRLEA